MEVRKDERIIGRMAICGFAQLSELQQQLMNTYVRWILKVLQRVSSVISYSIQSKTWHTSHFFASWRQRGSKDVPPVAPQFWCVTRPSSVYPRDFELKVGALASSGHAPVKAASFSLLLISLTESILWSLCFMTNTWSHRHCLHFLLRWWGRHKLLTVFI